ncbi:hypothetical protein ACJX0J_018280 [Zea mays]
MTQLTSHMTIWIGLVPLVPLFFILDRSSSYYNYLVYHNKLHGHFCIFASNLTPLTAHNGTRLLIFIDTNNKKCFDNVIDELWLSHSTATNSRIISSVKRKKKAKSGPDLYSILIQYVPLIILILFFFITSDSIVLVAIFIVIVARSIYLHHLHMVGHIVVVVSF